MAVLAIQDKCNRVSGVNWEIKPKALDLISDCCRLIAVSYLLIVAWRDFNCDVWNSVDALYL